MASSTKSLSFGVTDCKVSLLTDDPDGGTATYGTAVDVPGVTKINVKIAAESTQLRGDDSILDEQSSITGVDVSLENAKISLDVLAALYGGAVASSGATPNEVETWDLTGTSAPAFVKIEAITRTADPVAGNVTITIHKAIALGLDGVGAADKAYTSPKTEFKASPLKATGKKWFSVAINETAVTL